MMDQSSQPNGVLFKCRPNNRAPTAVVARTMASTVIPMYTRPGVEGPGGCWLVSILQLREPQGGVDNAQV